MIGAPLALLLLATHGKGETNMTQHEFNRRESKAALRERARADEKAKEKAKEMSRLARLAAIGVVVVKPAPILL